MSTPVSTAVKFDGPLTPTLYFFDGVSIAPMDVDNARVELFVEDYSGDLSDLASMFTDSRKTVKLESIVGLITDTVSYVTATRNLSEKFEAELIDVGQSLITLLSSAYGQPETESDRDAASVARIRGSIRNALDKLASKTIDPEGVLFFAVGSTVVGNSRFSSHVSYVQGEMTLLTTPKAPKGRKPANLGTAQ